MKKKEEEECPKQRVRKCKLNNFHSPPNLNSRPRNDKYSHEKEWDEAAAAVFWEQNGRKLLKFKPVYVCVRSEWQAKKWEEKSEKKTALKLSTNESKGEKAKNNSKFRPQGNLSQGLNDRYLDIMSNSQLSTRNFQLFPHIKSEPIWSNKKSCLQDRKWVKKSMMLTSFEQMEKLLTHFIIQAAGKGIRNPTVTMKFEGDGTEKARRRRIEILETKAIVMSAGACVLRRWVGC